MSATEVQDGPQSRRQNSASRIRSLDGLRGVTSIVVLLHHFLLLFPNLSLLNVSQSLKATPLELAVTHTPLHLFWAGSEAVLVFFVLSGLVLTRPVLASEKFRWRAYYAGRLIRLYVPVLGSVILAVLLTVFITRRSGPHFSMWLGAHDEPLSFGQAVLDCFLLTGTSRLNSPLWSLRYEVLFSLLLPLYVYVLRRLHRFWLPLLLASLAVTVVGGKGTDTFVVTYMAVFSLGVILALKLNDIEVLARRIDNARHASKIWVALTTLALVGLTYAWYPFSLVPLQFPVALVSAMLLIVVIAFWDRARALLELKPVLWLGSISFSLYLTHEPIVVSLGLILSPDYVWLAPLIGIPVAILVAWASYRIVEKPSHRLAKWAAARA